MHQSTPCMRELTHPFVRLSGTWPGRVHVLRTSWSRAIIASLEGSTRRRRVTRRSTSRPRARRRTRPNCQPPIYGAGHNRVLPHVGSLVGLSVEGRVECRHARINLLPRTTCIAGGPQARRRGLRSRRATHWRRPDLRREVVMPAKPEPRGRAEGYPVQRRHLRPAGRAFPQSGKSGRQLLPSGAVAGGP